MLDIIFAVGILNYIFWFVALSFVAFLFFMVVDLLFQIVLRKDTVRLRLIVAFMALMALYAIYFAGVLGPWVVVI